MSTDISGTVLLTPHTSVDISNSSAGFAVFTLLLQSDIIDYGNIIQYEYWISKQNNIPSTQNGFIPVENFTSSAGVVNQINISIPTTNNEFNDGSQVKVRAYVGSTDNSVPVIQVTEWSNLCPIHNPPSKPGRMEAYLIRGTTGDDKLYVQIPDDVSYELDVISFVVSYSFTDISGFDKWVVSPLITTWEPYPIDNELLLPEIDLQARVKEDSQLYVAVNAIYQYEFDSKTYYSVSEISETVQSADGEYAAPVLSGINPGIHYNVYANNTQSVNLSWLAPSGSLVPNFIVERYELDFFKNEQLVRSSTIEGDVRNIEYDLLSYINNTSSDTFTFRLKAIFDNQATEGLEQSFNSFVFSEAVTSQDVSWVNESSVALDGTQLYDALVTFSPPSSFGTSGNEPIKYVINVLDASGAVADTSTITHDPATTKYTEYFSNVATTATGNVEIYVKTTDTNVQDDGTTYLERAGPSVIIAYESSNLGAMTEPRIVNNDVIIEWSTNTPFDRYGTLFYNDTNNNSALTAVKFQTFEADYSDYEVVHIAPSYGSNLIYKFTFKEAFFFNNSIPAGVEVQMCISNSTGIENEKFTVPQP